MNIEQTLFWELIRGCAEPVLCYPNGTIAYEGDGEKELLPIAPWLRVLFEVSASGIAVKVQVKLLYDPKYKKWLGLVNKHGANSLSSIANTYFSWERFSFEEMCEWLNSHGGWPYDGPYLDTNSTSSRYAC